MGAGNVVLAYVNWHQLPDGPFRVLAFMCLVSLDRDAVPRYWGGRDELVRALGKGTDPTPADYQALKRAVRVLVDKGVLTVDKRPGPGHSAVYGLHLTGITQ
jgi:hypothetical protein